MTNLLCTGLVRDIEYVDQWRSQECMVRRNVETSQKLRNRRGILLLIETDGYDTVPLAKTETQFWHSGDCETPESLGESGIQA